MWSQEPRAPPHWVFVVFVLRSLFDRSIVRSFDRSICCREFGSQTEPPCIMTSRPRCYFPPATPPWQVARTAVGTATSALRRAFLRAGGTDHTRRYRTVSLRKVGRAPRAEPGQSYQCTEYATRLVDAAGPTPFHSLLVAFKTRFPPKAADAAWSCCALSI